MPTIVIPDDFHVHLRQGDMLPDMVARSAEHFGRVLAMPNTTPPLTTGDDAATYRDVCMKYGPELEVLCTIKLTDTTSPNAIRKAAHLGVTAAKLYPVGVTTNSEDGLSNITGRKAWEVFEVMEAVDMVLCIHGEVPEKYILDRETSFLSVLMSIVSAFPNLRIVLEHVSTADAVDYIRTVRPDNVAATITAHHLMLTLNDVIGGELKPHHFCKPIAKREEDRRALVEAATSGDSKFFFGSDSAPHLRNKKEGASGCAGVFTAPVAMAILAQVFESQNKLHNLEKFTSIHGADFYDLPLNRGMITLQKEDWVVPAEYNGVVPFMAGETLSWRVTEVER